MTDRELIKLWRNKDRIAINQTWTMEGLQSVEPTDQVLELWVSDVYMLEGFVDPLNEAQTQLVELAGEDTLFLFETWNARRIPQFNHSKPLPFRLIEQPVLKSAIDGFRMPVVAVSTDGQNVRQTLTLQGFHPSTTPDRVLFRKDKTFKLL